jgi:hypothetical protein
MPLPSQFSRVDQQNNIWWGVQIISSSLCRIIPKLKSEKQLCRCRTALFWLMIWTRMVACLHDNGLEFLRRLDISGQLYFYFQFLVRQPGQQILKNFVSKSFQFPRDTFI